jgi:uncharacterized tellurite resistance protein B-like protein
MNTVYYQLEREMDGTGTRIKAPEEKLRKLALAAGLLARVAHVDEDISEDEQRAMVDLIAAEWGLSEREAELLVRVSCRRTTRGLDPYRLSRGFFEHTTRQERRDFIRLLFRIANISDKTSFEEIEEIRKISIGLKISHDEFLEAKMSIPREDRKGL